MHRTSLSLASSTIDLADNPFRALENRTPEEITDEANDAYERSLEEAMDEDELPTLLETGPIGPGLAEPSSDPIALGRGHVSASARATQGHEQSRKRGPSSPESGARRTGQPPT